MARAFVRVGLGLCLSSSVGLWSLGAAAQGTGDIVEDESAPADQDDSEDQAADKEEDDPGDGDWSEGGGGGSSESGFHFGLRLGYGFPLGKATGASAADGGGAMSDRIAGQIPIWVDLGWQFTPSFMLGAYFSYGFVLPKDELADECDRQGVSCTLSDMRLGLQAQLSFSPGRSVDPWLGVGAGYEWLTVDAADRSSTLHGWEMFMLQGGLDFGGESGGSTIGPFVAFTFGQYSRIRSKAGSIDETNDVESKAMHNWLFVGIRGAMK